MEKFILKKLFDIRPLNRKGELDLNWILKGEKVLKISPLRIHFALTHKKKDISLKKTEKKEESTINYPAWENWKQPLVKSSAEEYEYEQIRQMIERELEAVEIREHQLRKDFGPPLNLPTPQAPDHLSRKFSLRLPPQILNLRLPSFSSSFKISLIGIILLSLIVPTVFLMSHLPSTKNFVLKSSTRAYADLFSGVEDLVNFQPQDATVNFQQSYQNFNAASGAINRLGGSLLNVVDILPLRYKVGAGKKILASGKAFAQAGTYLAKALEIINHLKTDNIFVASMDQDSSGPMPIFYLKNFEKQFKLAQEEFMRGANNLKTIKPSQVPQQYRQQFASLQQNLPRLEKSLTNLSQYFNLFLNVLGSQDPRHYLILFENNSEIRATGGFIGSYALLEVYQGQISKIDVKNIFDADGQLIVNIIPPKPIQKISSGWSTHDANWFFDFPTSAKKISWFFEKTGGPTTDGIIAITPQVIENLLSLLGPVNLPDENLTIDQNNFISEIQYKVEKDYDPYLNKPKQILSKFATQLIKKITKTPQKDWPKMLQILKQSLVSKDLLLWMRDPKEESFIAQQKWGGKIAKTSGDYLAVVNSNINGYKTDRFIKEEINLDTEINTDKTVIHHLTITRKHLGGHEKYEWYNKVNADYIRVYLPKGSKLLSGSGNTPEENFVPPLNYQKAKFKTDPLVQSIETTLRHDPKTGLDIFEESGKTVIGGWLYTSPGEETVFQLTYQIPSTCLNVIQRKKGLLPLEDSFSQNISYNLTIQRQPGAHQDLLRITINYPNQWHFSQANPEDQLISQKPIRFRDKLDRDKLFKVKFGLD